MSWRIKRTPLLDHPTHKISATSMHVHGLAVLALRFQPLSKTNKAHILRNTFSLATLVFYMAARRTNACLFHFSLNRAQLFPAFVFRLLLLHRPHQHAVQWAFGLYLFRVEIMEMPSWDAYTCSLQKGIWGNSEGEMVWSLLCRIGLMFWEEREFEVC